MNNVAVVRYTCKT